MENFKTVILDGLTASQDDLNWDALKALGDVEVFDRTPRELIIERAENADAVLTNKVPLYAEQLALLPKLKYVGVLATGYNNVDIEEAARRKIPVTNIPAYGTDSVAQLVFAHILNIANGVWACADSVSRGGWSRSIDITYRVVPQVELAGLRLGVIGYGTIGRKVAQIGLAFGMKISAFSPSRGTSGRDGAVEFKSVDEIFAESDIISLNCPLTDKTRNIIDAAAIAKMKRGVWIINTGRGPLIDEAALAAALDTGRVGAAGLDVLSREPPKDGNPLIGAKNCFITPHIAWTTSAARRRLMEIAFENLKAWKNGAPQNTVNKI